MSRAANLRYGFAFAAVAFAAGFRVTGSVAKGRGAASVAPEGAGKVSDIAIMSAMV